MSKSGLVEQMEQKESRIKRLEGALVSLLLSADVKDSFAVKNASDALSETAEESDRWVHDTLINASDFEEYWKSCGCTDLDDMARQLQQYKAQEAQGA